MVDQLFLVQFTGPRQFQKLNREKMVRGHNGRAACIRANVLLGRCAWCEFRRSIFVLVRPGLPAIISLAWCSDNAAISTLRELYHLIIMSHSPHFIASCSF